MEEFYSYGNRFDNTILFTLFLPPSLLSLTSNFAEYIHKSTLVCSLASHFLPQVENNSVPNHPRKSTIDNSRSAQQYFVIEILVTDSPFYTIKLL